MIGFFKMLLKSGAVDAIEYDFNIEFNHGEQKSKWIQAVCGIESSAEH